MSGGGLPAHWDVVCANNATCPSFAHTTHAGDAVLHPGQTRHGGRRTTRGTRIIAVGFVEIDGFEVTVDGYDGAASERHQRDLGRAVAHRVPGGHAPVVAALRRLAGGERRVALGHQRVGRNRARAPRSLARRSAHSLSWTPLQMPMVQPTQLTAAQLSIKQLK